MSEHKVELELKNGSVNETTQSLGEIEDVLNQLAEATESEYALVTVEPLTKDQHEANQSLRDLLQKRDNGD